MDNISNSESTTMRRYLNQRMNSLENEEFSRNVRDIMFYETGFGIDDLNGPAGYPEKRGISEGSINTIISAKSIKKASILALQMAYGITRDNIYSDIIRLDIGNRLHNFNINDRHGKKITNISFAIPYNSDSTYEKSIITKIYDIINDIHDMKVADNNKYLEKNGHYIPTVIIVDSIHDLYKSNDNSEACHYDNLVGTANLLNSVLRRIIPMMTAANIILLFPTKIVYTDNNVQKRYSFIAPGETVHFGSSIMYCASSVFILRNTNTKYIKKLTLAKSRFGKCSDITLYYDSICHRYIKDITHDDTQELLSRKIKDNYNSMKIIDDTESYDDIHSLFIKHNAIYKSGMTIITGNDLDVIEQFKNKFISELFCSYGIPFIPSIINIYPEFVSDYCKILKCNHFKNIILNFKPNCKGIKSAIDEIIEIKNNTKDLYFPKNTSPTKIIPEILLQTNETTSGINRFDLLKNNLHYIATIQDKDMVIEYNHEYDNIFHIECIKDGYFIGKYINADRLYVYDFKEHCKDNFIGDIYRMDVK